MIFSGFKSLQYKNAVGDQMTSVQELEGKMTHKMEGNGIHIYIQCVNGELKCYSKPVIREAKG